jgi:predicted dehydrogenase
MEYPLSAVLLGAGNRGTAYGNYALAHPEKLRFIAVAEPIQTRLNGFADRHRIRPEHRYSHWKDLLARERMADVAFVCTQDRMHTDATLQALSRGYQILLEKPMAHFLDDCVKIVRAADQSSRHMAVCHVLRYTDFFSKVQHIVRSGRLGSLISIDHQENVAWYHFSNSYVRGEWSNRETSSPVILAKCCHDLDLLHWITGRPSRRISSFGGLSHFRKENAPAGAPLYCVEGCPAQDTCLYYAPRIYIDMVPILQIARKSENNLYKLAARIREHHPGILAYLGKFSQLARDFRFWKDWPVTYLYAGQAEDFAHDYSDQAKRELLRTSPYGRCVYQTGNNVVDHQVVNIEFHGGVTANLSFHGFGEREGRRIRIDGTRGTLLGNFDTAGEKITVYDHHSGNEEVAFNEKLSVRNVPHGGGDFKLVDAFLTSLVRDEKPFTNPRETLESHLMAFAADTSRLERKMVDMDDFRSRALESTAGPSTGAQLST